MTTLLEEGYLGPAWPGAISWLGGSGCVRAMMTIGSTALRGCRRRLAVCGRRWSGLMLVLHHHLQEAANLLALLAQIGIQQGLV
ncbi:hypothetical protein JEK72_30655, partial [Klebsiella pneumoniae]|nr:hypothetical protein [Klebsiella pneumoniae]